jgi:hypothetical protein
VSTLTQWLSNSDIVKEVEQNPKLRPVGRAAEYVEPLRRRSKESNKTGRKGRPKAPPYFTRVEYRYDPNWQSKTSFHTASARGRTTRAKVAEWIRTYAAAQSAEQQQHLRAWCADMAVAVEKGNAMRAACCALYALRELESLVEAYVMPHAHQGLRKLTADKRKGHRGTW